MISIVAKSSRNTVSCTRRNAAAKWDKPAIKEHNNYESIVRRTQWPSPAVKPAMRHEPYRTELRALSIVAPEISALDLMSHIIASRHCTTACGSPALKNGQYDICE